MEMNYFKCQFVERTKEIVEQYKGDYEVTLLLNCLCGLVSLPTEYNKVYTDDNFQKACVEKIRALAEIKKDNGDGCIFNAIRNAISHFHIEFISEEGNIVSVTFKDIRPKDVPTGGEPSEDKFHTVFNMKVENIHKLALFVAEEHLKRLTPSSD